MRFDQPKKKAIVLYLLEKIYQRDKSIAKTVSDNFGINQNTVHGYIKELVNENIIRRVKRGEYELVENVYTYSLSRQEGHLDSDTYAFEAFLKQHLKDFDRNVKDVWAYAFSEMTNNVMDHSAAEHVRLIIIQNYLNTSVFLIDDGIGIFKKIKEYFGYDTLDDAIDELFKGKLTTDSANHSGEGIFFSSKLMDQFMIISDRKVFTHNKYEDMSIDSMQYSPQVGTCVYMMLSNFSQKNPQDVFDRYADIDGGFTKTLIPLKNMFDTAPVSRSQAKRVCNRLESFEEVIIDFADIDWIGQGFAHQIFVVFQSAHPQITFKPINMCDTVKKMYLHVTQTT